jgi:anti-sigma regulatory factor (Ser/Thr protein kinase)
MGTDRRDGPPFPRRLARLLLPPAASSAATARAAVRAAVAHRVGADVLPTVELLTCELVTNAIVHARTPCELRVIEPSEGVVRVEVHDRHGVPQHLSSPASAHPSEDHGRGLGLIDALSTAWGTTIDPPGQPPGKTVWVEVRD